MKTSSFSPYSPGGGGGVRAGIPASFPSRSPPPKQPFSAFKRLAKNRNLRGLGWFCGEKAPGPGGPGPKPWGPGPQAPWRPGPQALDPATLTINPEFLRRKPPTITPNPLTLGGVGWFPKAELYSFMRGGSRLRSSISAPSPWGPAQQAPEPCIPAA